MASLRLYLLGPPRIERDGRPVKLETRKAMALLAYLAATGTVQRRETVSSLLWPDQDSAHARAVLRRTLSSLKTALSGDSLVADRDSVALAPSAVVWSDVGQVRTFLAECLTHGHPASAVCPACLPLLVQATSLYGGEFLSNFSLKDSVDFDDWQAQQAESLRRDVDRALDMLVQGYADDGAYEPAITFARQWLALDRLNETAHGQLMRLYAWSGQRSAALRQYQECVAVLREQLGAAPQESLTFLYESIREGVAPRPPQPHQPHFTVAGEGPPVPAALTAARLEEKRIVTVLYADASQTFHGGTSAGMEDEASLVQSFVRVGQDIVRRYGGYIARSLGDSLLAVFGATQTHESDPELAIRAGLHVRDQATELGLRLAIGISTGEVFAGSAGSHATQQSDLVGKAIDLAVRLAGQAVPGQILVAEPTYRATRRAFVFTPSPVALVSEGPAVTAYQVGGLLAQPMKARGIEGLHAELTGRDGEMARLDAALAHVLHGQGQIVSIIGEAGIGKSRLVAELRERAFASNGPLLWLEGRCLELGTAPSYAPFLDILHAHFAWTTQDDEHRRRAAISSCLQGLVAQGYLPAESSIEMDGLLCRLLSMQAAAGWDERHTKLSPEQVRYLTFLAVRDFFVTLARRQPVVLVFEDLHWADDLSVDLLSLLMEELPEAALLLVCAYRPGQVYASRRLAALAAGKCSDCYTELQLRELSRQEGRRLIESLLTMDALPVAVQDFILERAQGNPFFLEETVRSLIDAGIVYREGDYWRARPEIDEAAVPDSIQSVILSRVDHLSERAKRVLQGAAVIGRIFRQVVLMDALQANTELATSLEELEQRVLIYQERTHPEIEYSFRHVLTQQTVYQNILGSQRAYLHQRVAEALEGRYSDGLGDYYEQLAYHYEKSGNQEKAGQYLYAAGDKAKRSFANQTAIAHLSKALQLLASLPDSPQRARRELELQIALGVPVAASKGYSSDDALQVYSRAHELCLQLGDRQSLFPALYGLWRAYTLRSQLSKALDTATSLMHLAQESQDPALLLEAHRALTSVYFPLADLAQAHTHEEQGIALYDPPTDRSHSFIYGHDPALTILVYSSWTLWLLGYADQGLDKSWAAVNLAKELSHPFNLAYANACTAMLHVFRGEVDVVEDSAGTAIALSTERAYPYWLAMASVWRGWALAQRGEPERGATEIRQGLGALQAIGVAFMRTLHLALLAEVHGKAGRPAEGLQLVDEALSAIAADGECVFAAEVHRGKGELLLMQGDAAEAEMCFQHALAVARGQRAKGWELRAATSLARLWQKQGKRADARALLQDVYNWFSEGFATADVRAARALLGELGAFTAPSSC